MKGSVFFIAVLLTFTTVLSKQISYNNCTGEELGEILSIDITPCDEEPCVLKRGGNETVTINFIPQEAVTTAKIYAYAIFGLIPVPLPLPDPDACQGHGLTCPLKSGEAVEFVYTEYISEDFPVGGLKLKAEIKDQNDNSIICGIVNLQISWAVVMCIFEGFFKTRVDFISWNQSTASIIFSH